MKDAYERALPYIDPEEVTQLTYDLVRIPSETPHELEASKFFAKILENMGLEVHLDYSVAEDRPNIIGRLPGVGGGRNLLLCGHIDTIPIGECVKPKIEGGRVYGRGAQDMKGSLAAITQAVKAILKSGVRLRGDLYLIAWVDHEIPRGRGRGVKAIAKAIRNGEIKGDAAVITEGPLESVKICQGGMAYYTITVSGPEYSYHSTLAPFRSNPILWAAELIRELKGYDDELNEKDWHPLIEQRPHLHACIIKGGDFFNRIPKTVEVTGNIRWDIDRSFNDVRSDLEKRLRRLQQSLWSSYDERVRFDLDMMLASEAAQISEDEEIVQGAKRAIERGLGIKPKVIGSRIVDDFGVMNLEGGIPTICLGLHGLGMENTSHSDIEQIAIKNLVAGSRVYLSLALDFCGVSD